MNLRAPKQAPLLEVPAIDVAEKIRACERSGRLSYLERDPLRKFVVL